MRNNRIVNPISREMLDLIMSLGYKKVVPDDQAVFDPYYDLMNEPWSASTCFLNMIAWGDTLPVYYKIENDMIISLCYESNEGMLVGIPFIGHYDEESFKKSFDILRHDFGVIKEKVVMMDITEWMLPYFERYEGYDFDIEDNRDYMEYIYSAESFEAGLDMQDDRYRYNYFKRKYDYEIVEITKDSLNEIIEFMDSLWCGSKNCVECHFGCLVEVTKRVVSAFDKIHAKGILVRVDGEMAGFCIVSMRMGQAVYQFKHAVNKMKGINEYLLKECYDRFLKGCDYINYTEDCGIESLRRYKIHLCPEYSLLSRLTLIEKE